MPTVTSHITLPSGSKESAWSIVSDLLEYPKVMADVLEARILDGDGAEGVSFWRALFNGAEVSWTQRHWLLPSRVVFAQIEGDLEQMRGEWRLEDGADGAVLSLTIEFDIGIPSLSRVLDPIAIDAIGANSRSMLSSIRRWVSSAEKGPV